jgi:hypothetical protein
VIGTASYLRIVGFAASALGGLFWPLWPGDRATILAMHSLWSLPIAFWLGFVVALFEDVEGDLDEDDDGPMTQHGYSWLPVWLKIGDLAAGIAATGIGLLANGLLLVPHNYFGLLPIGFGVGMCAGIWLAYAWPPKPRF